MFTIYTIKKPPGNKNMLYKSGCTPSPLKQSAVLFTHLLTNLFCNSTIGNFLYTKLAVTWSLNYA